MIYNIYIFDRHCNCIYHSRWNSPLTAKQQQVDPTPTLASPTTPAQQQQGGLSGTGDMSFEEETKLVYGVVFSLRNFMNKLSCKPQ